MTEAYKGSIGRKSSFPPYAGPEAEPKPFKTHAIDEHEHYKLLYLARLGEVKTLHKALNKRARKIKGMRRRIERLEARTR